MFSKTERQVRLFFSEAAATEVGFWVADIVDHEGCVLHEDVKYTDMVQSGSEDGFIKADIPQAQGVGLVSENHVIVTKCPKAKEVAISTKGIDAACAFRI